MRNCIQYNLSVKSRKRDIACIVLSTVVKGCGSWFNQENGGSRISPPKIFEECKSLHFGAFLFIAGGDWMGWQGASGVCQCLRYPIWSKVQTITKLFLQICLHLYSSCRRVALVLFQTSTLTAYFYGISLTFCRSLWLKHNDYRTINMLLFLILVYFLLICGCNTLILPNRFRYGSRIEISSLSVLTISLEMVL